jgi:predicted nucleotidyltransferase
MHFGLDAKILKSIAGVFARHSAITEARVYGSRARGDFKTGSDIDIALFAPALAFEEFLRVRGELDDLPCLYKMDTTHFDVLENAALREAILRDGRLLYRRGKTEGASRIPEDRPMFVSEDFPEYG